MVLLWCLLRLGLVGVSTVGSCLLVTLVINALELLLEGANFLFQRDDFVSLRRDVVFLELELVLEVSVLGVEDLGVFLEAFDLFLPHNEGFQVD